MMKRSVLFSAVAMAFAASTAFAGTKFATNLVPADPVDPPSSPTLSAKSQLKVSDKGIIQIGLAGVTDAGGLPAQTTMVYTDSLENGPIDLDGSEYIVIVKVYLPGIPTGLYGGPPNDGTVEIPIPMNLTAGKGKKKFNISALIGLLQPNWGRSVEIVGAEVWGPLGPANESACEALVGSPLYVNFGTDDASDACGNGPAYPDCRGGTKIGVSGLAIPLP